jgi:hypothetical protein
MIFYSKRDFINLLKSVRIEINIKYDINKNKVIIEKYNAGYNGLVLCGLKNEDVTLVNFLNVIGLFKVIFGYRIQISKLKQIFDVSGQNEILDYLLIVKKKKDNEILSDDEVERFRVLDQLQKTLDTDFELFVEIMKFKEGLAFFFDNDDIKIDDNGFIFFNNYILEDPIIDIVPSFELMLKWYGRYDIGLNTLYFLLEVPKNLFNNILNRSKHIGPVREIPSRDFKPVNSEIYERWYNGLGAWDYIYEKHSFLKTINKINNTLNDLETGYQISIKEYYEIQENDKFWDDLKSLLHHDNLSSLKDDLRILLEERNALSKRQKLIFSPIFNPDIELQPNDLGIGISQLMPIVVVNHAFITEVVMIEQPELHIHPAIQVEMADLFIAGLRNGWRGRQNIIETHSEHIMLRMLRRIEETKKRKSQHKENLHLKPEDLSVLFFEQTDKGVQVTHLPVDENGEFTEQWPKGFFEERAEELFPTYDENEEND